MRIPGEVSKKHYNMDNYPPEGTEEDEMEKLVQGVVDYQNVKRKIKQQEKKVIAEGPAILFKLEKEGARIVEDQEEQQKYLDHIA